MEKSIEWKDLYNAEKCDGDTTILCEIVGATNLVAAKRRIEDENEIRNASLPNSYCVVYWGDELIHQTKIMKKK